MKGQKFKISVGIITAAVFAAAFLGYMILSNSQYQSHALATNAAVFHSGSGSPTNSEPAMLDELSSMVSEDPASSALSLTEQLKNPLVKNAGKLKSSLVSPNAILVSVADRTILLDKNASQKIYPASMTKIMTVLLAIEEDPDLQEKITVPASLIDQLNAQDASMAGFEAGENVRAIDLLYGAVLPSGAECCITLADHLEGSEQNFVAKMNQKAASLGLKNTHFVNTSGLHDPNHYTTVKDLSILLYYALQNSTFRRIFTTPNYTTAATNKHPSGLNFSSTMFRNMSNPSFANGKVLGGKVGYTDQAGLCLASLAEKNGKEYILVTAGAKNCYRGEIKDALTVYNSLGK